MAFLTIFTPTYNRASLLGRGYQSLKRQSCKDFIWLIIDDGSSDNTADIVANWIQTETEFEIRYVYKENGGLHTGYNKAIELLDTELAVCIDSDDFLPDNAVDLIRSFWHENGSTEIAGIVALDCNIKGEIIGDPLPNQEKINLIDLQIGKYPIVNGDRKLVIRSDLYKSVAPQKTFHGEKNFNPHYMHLQISKKFDFLVLNKPLCIVEYQPEGMSNRIFSQYYDSPHSFAELRRLMLSFDGAGLKFRFRQSIHYVSSSILSKNRSFLLTSPAPFLTFLSIPFGLLLAALTFYKAKH